MPGYVGVPEASHNQNKEKATSHVALRVNIYQVIDFLKNWKASASIKQRIREGLLPTAARVSKPNATTIRHMMDLTSQQSLVRYEAGTRKVACLVKLLSFSLSHLQTF
jgi:hypothetical protein